MVSNTSKKCLLALVFFSSAAPVSLHCADGSRNSGSFWSKYGTEIAITTGLATGAVLGPWLVIRDHNMAKDLKAAQQHLENPSLPKVIFTPEKTTTVKKQ